MTFPSAPIRLDVRLPALRVGTHDLTDLHLTGTLTGQPLGAAPMVVLLGGITADDLPLGAADAPGWWPALGAADRFDPATTTVLAPALAGKGTSWAGLTDRAAPLPRLSAADLADLVAAWLDGIGAPADATVVGASLGGMVALALAARRPERVARLVVVSAGARPDAWGTGLRHLQREVVRNALVAGNAADGMRLARQLGMLTYRGRDEIEARFGPSDAERPAIASYLDHHGDKFATAFDPRAFLLLSGAIDRFPFGQDRAQIRASLSRVRARVVVVGVPQDLLFPFRLQAELHEDLVAVGVRSSLRTLSHPSGHDAFLAAQESLATLLDDAGLFVPDPPALPPPPAAPSATRTIRLGLVGAGTVGQALLQLLHERRADLAARHGLAFEVVGLAVRDVHADRGPYAQGLPRTTDALALVRDPLVEVVVEVAGGVAAMGPVVRAALEAGKPVVTANKALLADQLGPLAALATSTGTALAAEASAAAALPVLRSLARQVDGVSRVVGIVNGTSNFVLTRLGEGMDLDAAVARAQALGFAEADPAADLDGHDAAAKLTLLAYRAFGVWAPPDTFPVAGIRALTPERLALAEAVGHRLRHVAWAEDGPDGLHLAVEPVALPAWHLLAGVEEEYNAVYLDGDAAGDLAFFGRGAGGAPTASAVIADLVDVARGTAVGWPLPQPRPRRDGAHIVRRHLFTATLTPDAARRVPEWLRRWRLEVRRDARLGATDGHVAAVWLVDAAPEVVARAAVDKLLALPGVAEVARVGVLS